MSPTKTFSLLCLSSILSLQADSLPLPPLAPGTHLVALGSTSSLEMTTTEELELQIQQRFPKDKIIFRQLCQEGQSLDDLKKRDSELSKLTTDTILLFSGYREALDPESNPDTYRANLTAYLKHLKTQRYNGKSAPRVIVISPMAFDQKGSYLSEARAKQLSESLARYTEITQEITKLEGVEFIDFYKISQAGFTATENALTMEGLRLSRQGQAVMATRLILTAFGAGSEAVSWPQKELNLRLKEKTLLWSRYDSALQTPGIADKATDWVRTQVSALDPLVWDVMMRDPREKPTMKIVVSPPPGYGADRKKAPYLYSEETLKSIKLREGYNIEVFADEEDFPDLAKPVQMTFASDGNLWISTQPSAPAFSNQDVLINDKIIVLKDTNHDNKADAEDLFLGGLDQPTGPVFSGIKTYFTVGRKLVSNPTKPTAERNTGPSILLSGLALPQATTTVIEDASGNILLPRESGTASSSDNGYGTRQLPNGGVFRYDPVAYRLEVEVSKNIGNPRTSFLDRWGHLFLTDAETGKTWSALSLSASHSGEGAPAGEGILAATKETTYAAAIVDSRHFPDDLQGKLLLSGHQRIRLISLPDGSGSAKDEGDLLSSTDPNFFPIDLKFGPDGALYVLDWQDPGTPGKPNSNYALDHKHGRIYRISAKGRDLKQPIIFSDLAEPELFSAIQKGDGIDRSLAKRELRTRDIKAVEFAMKGWLSGLSAPSPDNDRCWLEALYLSVGRGTLDAEIAQHCLDSQDVRVRSATLALLARPEWTGKYPLDWLKKASTDKDASVRLGVIVACSRMNDEASATIFAETMKQSLSPQEEPAVMDACSVLMPQLQKLRADGKLDLGQIPALSKLMQ